MGFPLGLVNGQHQQNVQRQEGNVGFFSLPLPVRCPRLSLHDPLWSMGGSRGAHCSEPRVTPSAAAPPSPLQTDPLRSPPSQTPQLSLVAPAGP